MCHRSQVYQHTLDFSRQKIRIKYEAQQGHTVTDCLEKGREVGERREEMGREGEEE